MRADDELIARLAFLLHDTDPAPEAVRVAAVDAFRWRDPDAELGKLVAESAAEPAGVRGEGDRLLTFEAGGVVIDIEVASVGRLYNVVGQVAPPSAGQMRVEQPSGSVGSAVDGLGRFTVANVQPGYSRLVFTSASGERVRTAWTVF